MVEDCGRGPGTTPRPQSSSLQDLAGPSPDSRHLVGRPRPEGGGVVYLGPEGRKFPLSLSVVYLGLEGGNSSFPLSSVLGLPDRAVERGHSH